MKHTFKILRIIPYFIAFASIFFTLSIFLVNPTKAEISAPGGARDNSFDAGDGLFIQKLTGDVRAIIPQSDGKILVGGQMWDQNDNLTYFLKLNADGSIDETFDIGSGPNHSVYGIVSQSDGKILIIGNFTEYNGVPVSYIARLNADGSLDSSFDIGSRINANVHKVDFQSDGKLLCAFGGSTSGQATFDGIPVGRFVRINTDGSLDTTFDVGSGPDNFISDFAIQDDGKIVVGGEYNVFDGELKHYITRLNSDGSLDSSFDAGSIINATVYSVVIQPDGKILVGGNFTSHDSTSTNGIVRLNADGSFDSNFNVGTGITVSDNSNSDVRRIQLFDDGGIVIIGNFNRYNGLVKNKLAYVNSDGSIDSARTSNNGLIQNNIEAYSQVVIQSDGKLLVGTRDDNQTILRANSDGTRDWSFNYIKGLNQGVYLAKALPNDKSILIGDFTVYYGNLVPGIVQVNSDGSFDSSFNPGTGFDDAPYNLAIQPDGKIIIIGNFTTYDNNPVAGIVRLNTDGSIDSTFDYTGNNEGWLAIAIQSDGKIIVGDGSLVRLNSDGSIDLSFDPGNSANYGIQVIEIQSDGKILIGGSFTEYAGLPINYLARINLDGSLDTTFDIGTGFDSDPYTIDIQQNGKIIVTGSFTEYNGDAANGMIRLNQNGSLDTTFDLGDGFNNLILDVFIQNDNKIIVGGQFQSFNGTETNYVARLNGDGSLDTNFNTGIGFDSNVQAVDIRDDGSIMIGGEFIYYDDVGAPYLIQLAGGLAQYQVAGINVSLDVQSSSGSIATGSANGSLNPVENLTLRDATGVPISDFTLDLSENDVDFAAVDAGSDLISGKAFVFGLNQSDIPQLRATHSLYVPKLSNQAGAYICPNATQMSEVVFGCSGGYMLDYGTAGNLSIVNISGQDYWRITGLTGTGALGISISAPAERLVITPNTGTVSGTQEVALTYTPTSGFVSGDKIQFIFESTAGFTLENTCAIPTIDADGIGGNDGSATITGNIYEYTFSSTIVQAPLSFCINLTSPAVGGNYSVRLSDDNGTFDVALYYVQPDGNEMNVIANIAPTLSFNIVDLNDGGDTNSCDFGTVDTAKLVPNANGTVDATRGECGYALAIGTNSQSGFLAQITSDGALRTSTASINNVTDDGSWSAGTEAYGIAEIIPGTTGRNTGTGLYTEAMVEESTGNDYSVDASPVPTAAENFISYTDGVQYMTGVDSTDITKVIHGLVVGAGTPAGAYSQVVTYTVTASF